MTGTFDKVVLCLVLAGMTYLGGPLPWRFFLLFGVVILASDYGIHRWRNRTWRIYVGKVRR